MNEKKTEKLMMDCYVELFCESTPKGDFHRMVDEAKIDKFGQKHIPFNDFLLEEEKMDEIIEKYAMKIKRKWERRRFRNSILMGCSPKTIYKS